MDYNTKHGITPRSVVRPVQASLSMFKANEGSGNVLREGGARADETVLDVIRELEGEMAEAAQKLEYERAALLRDQIRELKKQAGMSGEAMPQQPVNYRDAIKKKRGKKG
jgi:excinuclease ABC subunit B